MTLKKCSKCGIEKATTDFRWLYSSNRYMAECKACERMRIRKHQYGTARQKAVDKIITLCRQFDTNIVSEALTQLGEIQCNN